MRIISGEFGGRRLAAPKGSQTRPTAERVRESLFSILGTPPTPCRVLDLFAGAGTLGFEALSRGATQIVFVELSKRASTILRNNIESLGLEDRTRIIRAPVERALDRFRGEKFNWIFADPPYASEHASVTLSQLDQSELLAVGGIIVIEHDRRRQSAQYCGSLVKTEQRQYGDTALSLYSYLQ